MVTNCEMNSSTKKASALLFSIVGGIIAVFPATVSVEMYARIAPAQISR